MYRLGRPTIIRRPKKLYLFEAVAILLLVIGGLFAAYWFVIKKDNKAVLTNNDTPLISKVEAADKFTEINEPTFTLRLPGTWKETERNNDARYRSIKWDYQAKGGIGRWVKVFIDTIPEDYSVTYVLPVSAEGNEIVPEGISDHCSQFTPGARKPDNNSPSSSSSSERIASTWQGVKFLCDGAHPLYQRVGTSSKSGLNSVSVTGPTKGTHRYFFVYDDAYYNPDFTILSTILDSFRAK